MYAAYHVAHRVLASPGRPHEYDVQHSSLLYYVGVDGRLRGFGDWTDSQGIVTQNVRELLSQTASAGQRRLSGIPVARGGGDPPSRADVPTATARSARDY